MPQFDSRKQELQEKLVSAASALGVLDMALRDSSHEHSSLVRDKAEPSRIRLRDATHSILQTAYREAVEKLTTAAEDFALHSPTSPR